MRTRGLQCAIALCLWVACGVTPAYGGWPLQAAAPTLLGYGQEYVGRDGSSHTHSGSDIGCESGQSACAALGGRVTFAGRIPAGEGASTLAVTILGDDGLRYTYLPLDSIDVAADDTVDAGCVLGSVAPTGDDSSQECHLHVSVRRGDTYLDPLTVLVAPPTQSPTQPSTEDATADDAAVVVATVDSALSCDEGSTSPVEQPEAHATVTDRVPNAESVATAVASPAGVGAAHPDAAVKHACAPRRVGATDPLPARTGGAGETVTGSSTKSTHSPGGRTPVRLAALFLSALAPGALWPLWRRARSSVSSCVTAKSDEIAAAVGR